ncbi:uncharacterized, partial [Tachysurus ichikawai]
MLLVSSSRLSVFKFVPDQAPAPARAGGSSSPCSTTLGGSVQNTSAPYVLIERVVRHISTLYNSVR